MHIQSMFQNTFNYLSFHIFHAIKVTPTSCLSVRPNLQLPFCPSSTHQLIHLSVHLRHQKAKTPTLVTLPSATEHDPETGSIITIYLTKIQFSIIFRPYKKLCRQYFVSILRTIIRERCINHEVTLLSA